MNTFKTSLSSIWIWPNWKANSTLECTHESVSDISLAARGMNLSCRAPSVFHCFKWPPSRIIYWIIVLGINVSMWILFTHTVSGFWDNSRPYCWLTRWDAEQRWADILNLQGECGEDIFQNGKWSCSVFAHVLSCI